MTSKRVPMLVAGGLLGLALACLVAGSPTSATAAGVQGPASAPGGVITVCLSAQCDCVTVQDAVDAASDGDTIKVAAGTYTDVSVRPRKDITTTGVVTQAVYISKTVTIRGGYTTTNWVISDPDANPTTLDAQGQGRVLYVTGEISPTIQGLRITGGDATALVASVPWSCDTGGGGVFVYKARAILSNNKVLSNAASCGGGLYLLDSSAQISDNTISGNALTGDIGDRGGGLYLNNSPALISGNVISGNAAIGFVWGGAGLYLVNSPAVIIGNVISSNTAHVYAGTAWGGGLWLVDTAATVKDNVISGNDASGYGAVGGGLSLENSPALVSGNLINANTVGGRGVYGGGVYLGYSNATLNDNTITGNTASGWWGSGGGSYLYSSDATLVNNVVADNQVSAAGSGLYVRGSSLRLLHSTIARNIGGDGSGVYITDDPDSYIYSTVWLTNTIIVSHTVGISVASGNTVTLNSTLWHDNTAISGGAGLISHRNDYVGDPAFLDPDGGDYHIGPGSAALDQGVATDVMLDIDHEPRSYQAPDLGADEYWPPSALKPLYLPLIMRDHP